MSDNKKHTSPSKPGSSFLTGVLSSVLLSIVYLKFGYTPPAWLQPSGLLKQLASEVAASIAADKQDINEVQRGIALDFGWNPDKFIELDTALGHFISEEYYWQQKGQRRIQQLKSIIQKTAEIQKRGEYKSLQDPLDRALRGLAQEARKEHVFIRKFLKRRFPNCTNEQIIEKLETYNAREVIQRPSVGRAIHFQPVVTTKVQVEVLNAAGEIVRRLIDAKLPAGQYWVYWDQTDESGQKSDLRGKYSFRVLYNGQEETAGPLG